MIFWSIAIVMTLIACAALYYAASGRMVNAVPAGMDEATASHFRLRLKEIEDDVGAGELAPDQAEAARAELARELVRQQADSRGAQRRGVPGLAFAVPASLVLVIGVSFATYFTLGSPNLPSEPLAGRADVAQRAELQSAIAKIEAQLEKTPDDVRGWKVLAPVYMHEGRYADAEHALRRIIALDGPTAANQTDLAEALMMQNGGDASGEPTRLLRSAAAMDPADVRSRFYLAGEDMRKGDYAAAVTDWKSVIALAKGNEQWLPTARSGLAAAEDGVAGKPLPAAPGVKAGPAPNGAAIKAMVAGLAQRLESQGGSIEEWTRLVRSRLVLGQTEAAQKAYDAAKRAYPSVVDRADLDTLALGNGLK